MLTFIDVMFIHGLASTSRMRTAVSPRQWIFPVHLSDGYAMLISPNKGETAVLGCHCPFDMVVSMREVLARPCVGVCAPPALSLSYLR